MIVDIENIVGGQVATEAEAAEARAMVLRAVDVGNGDHVVLGAAPGNALVAYLGWGGAPRLVVGSGPDGADLALLDVLYNEHIEDRFGRVVIVSGDGIFAAAAARLGASGVHVTVVAHSRGLSKRLKIAAGSVVTFSDNVAHAGDAA